MTEYDVYIKCPKCKSMNDPEWSHCEGKCPISYSPFYDRNTRTAYGTIEVVRVPRG